MVADTEPRTAQPERQAATPPGVQPKSEVEQAKEARETALKNLSTGGAVRFVTGEHHANPITEPSRLTDAIDKATEAVLPESAIAEISKDQRRQAPEYTKWADGLIDYSKGLQKKQARIQAELQQKMQQKQPISQLNMQTLQDVAYAIDFLKEFGVEYDLKVDGYSAEKKAEWYRQQREKVNTNLYSQYLKGESNVKKFTDKFLELYGNDPAAVVVLLDNPDILEFFNIFGGEETVNLLIHNIEAKVLLRNPDGRKGLHDAAEDPENHKALKEPEKSAFELLAAKKEAMAQKAADEAARREAEAGRTEAKKLREEIFARVRNRERTSDQLGQLMNEAIAVLQKEKQNIEFSLTVAEMNEKFKDSTKLVRSGEIVFIPKGEGQIIAIGDVHGDLASVEKVLTDAGFFENMLSQNPNMQIVFMGDLLDRGPKSPEVLELVLELKTRYPNSITILRADHEDRADRLRSLDDDFERQFMYRYLSQEDIFGKDYTATPDDIAEINSILDGYDLDQKFSYRGLSKEDIQKYRQAVIDRTKLRLEGKTDFSAVNKVFEELAKKSTKGELEFQNFFLQDFFMGFARKKLQENPLYKKAVQALNAMPRMVVVGNGLIFVHGGPPVEIKNIHELASISLPQEVRQVFDREIAWADVASDADVPTLEAEKQRVIGQINQYVTNPPTTNPPTADQIESLKKTLELLRTTPGLYFNPKRIEDGDYLDAIRSRKILYSKQYLEKWLSEMGAKVLVRGHEQDTGIIFDGKEVTLHNTGKGSPETRMGNVNAVYGVFDRNQMISQITNSNLREVW